MRKILVFPLFLVLSLTAGEFYIAPEPLTAAERARIEPGQSFPARLYGSEATAFLTLRPDGEFPYGRMVFIDTKSNVLGRLDIDKEMVNGWHFTEISAVSFKDVNGDGLVDVLAIGRFMTGIGPEGAKDFPVVLAWLRDPGSPRLAFAMDTGLQAHLEKSKAVTLPAALPAARAFFPAEAKPTAFSRKTHGTPLPEQCFAVSFTNHPARTFLTTRVADGTLRFHLLDGSSNVLQTLDSFHQGYGCDRPKTVNAVAFRDIDGDNLPDIVVIADKQFVGAYRRGPLRFHNMMGVNVFLVVAGAPEKMDMAHLIPFIRKMFQP